MPHWFQCHRKSLFSLIGCLWLALTIGGLAAVGAMPLTVNKICRSGPRSFRAAGLAAVRAGHRVDVIEPRDRDAQLVAQTYPASVVVRVVPARFARVAPRRPHETTTAHAHAPPGPIVGPTAPPGALDRPAALASAAVLDFVSSIQPAWAFAPLSVRPPPASAS